MSRKHDLYTFSNNFTLYDVCSSVDMFILNRNVEYLITVKNEKYRMNEFTLLTP
jgi:hypothetical protein